MFSFSNFTFDFNGFHVIKLKIIQCDSRTGAEENLGVNNKDNRVSVSV